MLTSKIKLPIEIKIAAIMLALCLIFLLLALITVFPDDDWRGVFLLFVILFVCHILFFIGLFNGKKQFFYAGMFSSFVSFITFAIIYYDVFISGWVDNIVELIYLVFSIVNLFIFTVLLIGRKKYFAAVDKAK